MIDIRFVTWKILLLSAFYFFIILSGSIAIAAKMGSHSLFDFIVHLQSGGSAGNFTLAFGTLPLLAFLLPSLIDLTERDHIVLRLQNKTTLYRHHILFSIIASGIFVSLMALAGLAASMVLVGHTDNLWTTKQGSVYFLLENKELFPLYISKVASWKVWGYILASRFLATLFMSLLIIALKLLLRKNILVFFSALLLLGTDALLPRGFSLFLGRTRIDLETWLSPADQWFNLVYFSLGIVLLFFLSGNLYRKKEFL